MSVVRHTNGGIEAGLQSAQDQLDTISDALDAAIQKDEETPRSWQVGDLISIGRFPERRLILSVYNALILVIAESGWWNMYEIDSSVKIHFIASTGLEYDYRGRQQAYLDYTTRQFTQHFQTH